ncbi:MAG: hypothetical protein IKT57_01890 [Clostridia bacterium]|nr:hypothetical protein [Clostridia bacterium]
MLLILVEALAMCFILLITCVIAIANGAKGGIALYEEDVQERAVALGYTTKAKIRKNLVILSAAMFIPVFTLVPLMVYCINGAASFIDAFWQMTAILWIMGLFDRLFIDWYWVGHTKAWHIPGTEDLKPYIPRSALLVKWLFTLLGFPLISASIAGIISLLS